MKTAEDLKKNLPDFGISYGLIASDDWNSFAAAFKGGNHRAGKKHTVGIEWDNCRLRHLIRQSLP
ncbi:MAG: hypothetical protein LBL90_12780 [Prevotellaceae bacterium]|nr:hypothetical protein [Prevotellaceae bacterium]